MVPSFKISHADMDLIAKIVTRAIAENGELKHHPRIAMVMDLTACHANGCPLDLAALLEAKPLDFEHDVYGVYAHLNRETGKLEDCFLPRYAKTEG